MERMSASSTARAEWSRPPGLPRLRRACSTIRRSHSSMFARRATTASSAASSEDLVTDAKSASVASEPALRMGPSTMHGCLAREAVPCDHTLVVEAHEGDNVDNVFVGPDASCTEARPAGEDRVVVDAPLVKQRVPDLLRETEVGDVVPV